MELLEKDYNLVAEWYQENFYCECTESLCTCKKNALDVINELLECAKGHLTHNDMCVDSRCLVSDYEDFFSEEEEEEEEEVKYDYKIEIFNIYLEKYNKPIFTNDIKLIQQLVKKKGLERMIISYKSYKNKLNEVAYKYELHHCKDLWQSEKIHGIKIFLNRKKYYWIKKNNAN